MYVCNVWHEYVVFNACMYVMYVCMYDAHRHDVTEATTELARVTQREIKAIGALDVSSHAERVCGCTYVYVCVYV